MKFPSSNYEMWKCVSKLLLTQTHTCALWIEKHRFVGAQVELMRHTTDFETLVLLCSKFMHGT